MKKILPRLALLAAPFLVYFALFFAFEPYDYFASKAVLPAKTPSSRACGLICPRPRTPSSWATHAWPIST